MKAMKLVASSCLGKIPGSQVFVLQSNFELSMGFIEESRSQMIKDEGGLGFCSLIGHFV